MLAIIVMELFLHPSLERHCEIFPKRFSPENFINTNKRRGSSWRNPEKQFRKKSRAAENFD